MFDKRNPKFNPFEVDSNSLRSQVPGIRPRPYEHNECPSCGEKCVGHYTGSSAKYDHYAGECRLCGAQFVFTTSGTVHAARLKTVIRS